MILNIFVCTYLLSVHIFCSFFNLFFFFFLHFFELQEFFVYSKYKTFVRYMVCRDFHFLRCLSQVTFSGEKKIYWSIVVLQCCLISAVSQSDSSYIFFFIFFSIMVFHRILNIPVLDSRTLSCLSFLYILVVSSSVMSSSLWSHVACQASLSVNFPGKNTGVGSHFLLQGIFLT